MSSNKYINTTDVVKMTGIPYKEIMELIKSGVLSSHKARRGHYRLNVAEVEDYFKLAKTTTKKEVVDKSENTAITQPFDDDKVVCGHTARKYLHCSKLEFERLVEEGHIQAYRDEFRRWKVSKKSIIDYLTPTPSTPSQGIRLITENFYHEVLERICEAQSSIKIMTADFKRFNLKPTAEQGKGYNDGTPFIKLLMEKAKQGVSVQIICSKPSQYFSQEWKGYYKQMGNPKNFKYKFCDRNHSKAVIIDDKHAYVGSANVTPAGLGQGIFTPGNFEMGILTDNQEFISSIKTLFSKILKEYFCDKCHRKVKCKEKSKA